MGNFYTNVVVHGASEDDVAATLGALGRSAYVASKGEFVFVYDEKADRQREGEIESIALTLATRLKVPTLAALNHDDDVLLLWLYDRAGNETRFGWGVRFDAGERSPSATEFSAAIRAAFGTLPDTTPPPHLGVRMWLLNFIVLRRFAVARHQRILKDAGIPQAPAMMGHTYVVQGELRERDPELKLRRV